MVDVCNYSLTYNMGGNVNHMSPDDHYQDLKRIIAAFVKEWHNNSDSSCFSSDSSDNSL